MKIFYRNKQAWHFIAIYRIPKDQNMRWIVHKNTFSCHFTDGGLRRCARNVCPFDNLGIVSLRPSSDTIFNNGIVIVGLLALIMPIRPRNCFVIADILPVVLTIWILNSQIEKIRSTNCLSSLCDYFVIQNFNPWFKKTADTKISKTIFTVFRCFSEIISSGFKVEAVA